ncbi:ubiquinol-cytochrome-c reductase complex assembly factor 4 isoform X2 [Dunckerocampus dactyliophorus]|uniref:ubiquinol-cytochrome-c reductase complex assembly factor 4 isoform X2 n=1 Tax=Dunckerocampus dactyliophorus TaxID=161453 RepID=UPI002406D0CD|nr:ubiquinol-cytochrome-c reductase complex assembly factor 4 isoform X2 [Dunckerocampus dactyliophorus]
MTCVCQTGVRSLSVSHHMLARPNKHKDDQEEVNNEPIKFSTSKASHRTWNVDRSMGSHYERPWWKVLPLSAAVVSFLLWCATRDESDIDKQLEKDLYQRLPGLLSDDDEKK